MNGKTSMLFSSLFVTAQLALLTALGFAQAPQPSQSEILDRWAAALGGRQKIAAVERSKTLPRLFAFIRGQPICGNLRNLRPLVYSNCDED